MTKQTKQLLTEVNKDVKIPKVVDAESTKLITKYCIPEWLREEQIRLSCARFKGRISRDEKLREEPVALVCFGPSLNQSWEKLKDFKHIISCSGSHKFLIDHGITPRWHVDVDPRQHKATLIGDTISPDTEFLMASCVHPKVFDHLQERNARITLWHTYSGEKKDTVPNIFPRGDWVLTGGANVGLRALVIARFLGFTDVHIFGMDGSFPSESAPKHAAFHPNTPKKHIVAQYNNKDYLTTEAFLTCARMTFHELEMLPDVSATFYGDGLIQDMAKTKKLNHKEKSGIAFYSPAVISDSYIAQNRLLHEGNAHYGVSVLKHVETIKRIYSKINANSLLDYGCGKGLLAKNLDFPIWEYDPAIPGKDSAPRRADLVVCIDVLEHIEPDYLDNVLNDILRVTKQVAFIVISTKKAQKLLADGRNTHLIVNDKQWWTDKLSLYFNIPSNGIIDKGAELHFVVARKEIKPTQEKLIVSKAENVF